MAKLHGGPDTIAKHHQAGKLTLRERIELLVDKDSFNEYGKIAGYAEYDEEHNTQSVVPSNFLLGMAKINKRDIVVGGEDFTIKGGSPNPAGLRKSVYSESLALQRKCPLVRLHEGGGGSVAGTGKGGPVGDSVNSPDRFSSVAKTLHTVPVASAALGPVAGLPAARFVASHFKVMVDQIAQVMIAGPAVVKRAFSRDMTKQELGGAHIHSANGVVDLVVASEAEAMQSICDFLSYMPQHVYQLPPRISSADSVERIETSLLDLVPEDRRKTFDMRHIIQSTVDDQKFFEMSAKWGKGLITGLARYNGQAVGVLANNGKHYAGSVDIHAALKCTRFVKLCETFHFPIVSFVDNPGFLIGPLAEQSGAILHGTDAVLAVSESTVPWISVVVRKSYGVAQAINYGPNGFVVHWPSAEGGALPIEGGVAVAFKRQIEASDNPEELRQQLEDKMYHAKNPLLRADSFSIHELIDPRETRPVICQWLQDIDTAYKLRIK